MATIKTIKYVCPYCKKKINLRSYPQRNLTYYGCVRRECRHCGTFFFDYRIKEIGLFDKEKTYPPRIRISIGWLVFYIFIVVFCAALCVQNKSLQPVPVFMIILLSCVALQVLSDLLLYKRRIRRWQKEYDQSAELLKNPLYHNKVRTLSYM